MWVHPTIKTKRRLPKTRLALIAAGIATIVGLWQAVPLVSAHRTDPWHPGWTLWFNPMPDKNPQVFRMTVSERLTWPSANPDAFYRLPRSFTVRLPEGFEVLRFDGITSSSECTVQDNTATCNPRQVLSDGWRGNPSLEGYPRTLVAWVPDRQLPEGSYTATVEGTITLPDGSTQTESDSVVFNLDYPGNADLVWSTDPASPVTLEAGDTQPLAYVLRNDGPDNARDVEANIYHRFGSAKDIVRLAPPIDGCSERTAVGTNIIDCAWDLLSVGGSKRVNVSAYAEPVPGVALRDFEVSPFARSYETQPDSDNDLTAVHVKVKCDYYAHPTAVVDITAKLTKRDCLVVDRDATVAAKVKVGNGAHVGPGGAVGKFASIGSFSHLYGDKDGRQGSIGAHAKLGNSSRLVGELGDHASVGDNVGSYESTVGWVIVEPRASIGDGVSLYPDFSTIKGLRVFAGAHIPKNTFVDAGYCQANPAVCEVFEL